MQHLAFGVGTGYLNLSPHVASQVPTESCPPGYISTKFPDSIDGSHPRRDHIVTFRKAGWEGTVKVVGSPLEAPDAIRMHEHP